MPDITIIHFDGSEEGFEAPEGVSLMQAATGHGIVGIVAECGGSAMCATCHVIVDEAWADRLPPPSAVELDMLENSSILGRKTPVLPVRPIDTSEKGALGSRGFFRESRDWCCARGDRR